MSELQSTFVVSTRLGGPCFVSSIRVWSVFAGYFPLVLQMNVGDIIDEQQDLYSSTDKKD